MLHRESGKKCTAERNRRATTLALSLPPPTRLLTNYGPMPLTGPSPPLLPTMDFMLLGKTDDIYMLGNKMVDEVTNSGSNQSGTLDTQRDIDDS